MQPSRKLAASADCSQFSLENTVNSTDMTSDSTINRTLKTSDGIYETMAVR